MLTKKMYFLINRSNRHSKFGEPDFLFEVCESLLEGNALSLPPSCKGRAFGNDGALLSTNEKHDSLKLPSRKSHALSEWNKRSSFLPGNALMPHRYE